MRRRSDSHDEKLNAEKLRIEAELKIQKLTHSVRCYCASFA
jgi:hypothetical protein